MDYESTYLFGGSAGTFSIQGALSSCIVAKKDFSGRSVIYGAFYGDRNANGDKSLSIISFMEVTGGRDIPYKEVVSGLTWTAGTAYVIGDIVMPSPGKRNGRLYMATFPGTSSGTEPTWPTSNGGVVLDGGNLIWTEITDAATNVRLPNLYGTTFPRIAMEPDFKEFDFGSHMVDKMVKRFDISAYFSAKNQVWMDVLCNGGNNRFFAGPAVIGPPSAGKDSAGNELGALKLDDSSLADEFQARQLRPALSTDRVKPDTVVPGIIRGRTVQPRLREGSGFVIDDTNDYIVTMAYTSATGQPDSTSLKTAQITHGYYANVNALLTQIVADMNSVPAGWGGGTVEQAGPNSWGYDSTFAAVYPYMVTFTFEFGLRDTGAFIAFLTADDSDLQWAGETWYTTRCRRLLAMLGFDTGRDQASVCLVSNGTIEGDDDTHANIVSEQNSPVLAEFISPGVYKTRISATQSIPYLRSSVVAITEIEGEFVVKRGRPMPMTPRTS
jgi:hypothetical protein